VPLGKLISVGWNLVHTALNFEVTHNLLQMLRQRTCQFSDASSMIMKSIWLTLEFCTGFLYATHMAAIHIRQPSMKFLLGPVHVLPD